MHFLLLITSILVIGFTSLVSVPGSPYLIGGMTQADISNMFATAITPAGITFAIWSLIYLSWIIAGIYIAFFSKKKPNPPTPLHRGAIGAFSSAIALTALWLIPWGNIWIGTALIVMLTILWLLGYVFSHTRQVQSILRSSIEITFAWIIMATALNITVWIRSLGSTFGAPGDIYYAVFSLGALLIWVAWLQCRYRAYIISLVFLWTLFGVWIAHPEIEERAAVIIYALVTLVNMGYSYSKKK